MLAHKGKLSVTAEHGDNIHIIIASNLFDGLSFPQRDDVVWPMLENALAEQEIVHISLCLLLTEEEALTLNKAEQVSRNGASAFPAAMITSRIEQQGCWTLSIMTLRKLQDAIRLRRILPVDVEILQRR